jgi:hypothetical protein
LKNSQKSRILVNVKKSKEEIEKMSDRDFSVLARRVVERAIGERLDGTPLDTEHSSKDLAAVSRGRLGGLKGGHARAKKLSSKRRKAIALKAAKTRWKK